MPQVRIACLNEKLVTHLLEGGLFLITKADWDEWNDWYKRYYRPGILLRLWRELFGWPILGVDDPKPLSVFFASGTEVELLNDPSPVRARADWRGEELVFVIGGREEFCLGQCGMGLRLRVLSLPATEQSS